jgi:fermentation-respiration switch protein FrsA (DUF1100 family)
MLAMADYPTRAQLAAIAAPTLVIRGDLDGLVPLARGRELAASIPGARLLVFPGVGPSQHIERTDEFNRAVLDFLVRLAGRRAALNRSARASTEWGSSLTREASAASRPPIRPPTMPLVALAR